MGVVIQTVLLAIFRFFGLGTLAGRILGFLSGSGPIVAFFLYIGKKISIKAIVLPIQFAVMGALIVAKVAFLVTAISLVLWVYNQFHTLMDTINSMVNMDSAFGIAWQVLQSIGFVDALFDTFSNLSFIWISILILLVSKLVLHSLKLASDEMFKIGLLMGQ